MNFSTNLKARLEVAWSQKRILRSPNGASQVAVRPTISDSRKPNFDRLERLWYLTVLSMKDSVMMVFESWESGWFQSMDGAKFNLIQLWVSYYWRCLQTIDLGLLRLCSCAYANGLPAPFVCEYDRPTFQISWLVIRSLAITAAPCECGSAPLSLMHSLCLKLPRERVVIIVLSFPKLVDI